MFAKYKEKFLQGLREFTERIIFLGKWMLLATGMGILAGMLGAGFYHCLMGATEFRQGHPFLIFGLPLGGLFIVWLYRVMGREQDKGTNTVISAVRQENTISWKMAPLIFVGTIVTHFFGGSAGREGAALQMGGSIGNGIGTGCKPGGESAVCARRTFCHSGFAGTYISGDMESGIACYVVCGIEYYILQFYTFDRAFVGTKTTQCLPSYCGSRSDHYCFNHFGRDG